MPNSTKLKFLSTCVVFCLAVIAGLGFSTWTLYDKVNKIENSQASIYSSEVPSMPLMQKNDQLRGDIWNHFNSMPKHFSEMNAWMDDVVNDFMSGRSMLQQPGVGMSQQSPTIEFEETDDEYKIIIEMPEGEGVELNTEISDGVFFVSGRVKRTYLDKGSRLFMQSRFSSEFSRSFVLDEPVDQAAMEVINENGKAIVLVPKVAG